MRILISNDDGVHSPGIVALADALAAQHKVLVVAPDRDHSGASNSLTLTRPLSLDRMPNVFTAVMERLRLCSFGSPVVSRSRAGHGYFRYQCRSQPG